MTKIDPVERDRIIGLQLASFLGTLGFAYLVLAALFVAALVAGDRDALDLALIAMAAAYVSQALATFGRERWALAFQVASMLSAIGAFLTLQGA